MKWNNEDYINTSKKRIVYNLMYISGDEMKLKNIII